MQEASTLHEVYEDAVAVPNNFPGNFVHLHYCGIGAPVSDIVFE